MESLRKVAAAASVAVAVVAAAAGVWSAARAGEGATTSSATSSTTTVQGENCVASAPGAVANCTAPEPNPSADSAAEAERIFRPVPPEGPGPWPFMVLHDDVDGKNVGAWVRSDPGRDGKHIGLAQHGTALWVDCVRVNDFDPDPGTGNGPRWYLVRWPNGSSSDAAFASSPSDPAQGWTYSYYARPNGHDGSVPACPA